ncbi:hypothetical protein [Histophilus somni]|uniref:hypothetical protein n=1 Tax=Histophilus somni TaxID=731 RepID=UPI00201F1734|nr:hypothetical protein [Histophilus somni]
MYPAHPFLSSTQYHPTNLDLEKVDVDDLYQIERLATQYKKDKDWNGALACLYQANLIHYEINGFYSVEILLRLAKYLQASGRFEEAKFELQNLLNNADEIIGDKISWRNDEWFERNEIQYEEFLEERKIVLFSQIFSTAALIYKKQKLKEQALEFEKIAQKYVEISRENLKKGMEKRKNRLERQKTQREQEKQEYITELETTKKRQKTLFWLSVLIGLILVKWLTK